MEEDLDELFRSATSYIRQIAGKLETNKLIYFYGRYKQAMEGPCNTSKPGFFDFQGKQKWDAWNKLGNMSKSQAMVEYVTELGNVDPDWQEKLSSTDERTEPRLPGLGFAVSTLAHSEDEISDEDKDVFDWCKEGDTQRVKNLLDDSGVKINNTDDCGMCLLHWAADRGYADMVRLLLEKGSDVNQQDEDGQTALHYAVSCEHLEVIKLLLSFGCDKSLENCDGETCLDITTDKHILTLLNSDHI